MADLKRPYDGKSSPRLHATKAHKRKLKRRYRNRKAAVEFAEIQSLIRDLDEAGLIE